MALTPLRKRRSSGASLTSPPRELHDHKALLTSPPRELLVLECALCPYQSQDASKFDGAVCGKCALTISTDMVLQRLPSPSRCLPVCSPWIFASWLPPFGLCGAHMCLLGRRRQALLYGQTCGLFGLGWLFDAIALHSMSDRWAPGPDSFGTAGLKKAWAVYAAAGVSLAYGLLVQSLWVFTYPHSFVPTFKVDARSFELPYRLTAHLTLAIASALGAHLAYSSTSRTQTRSFGFLVFAGIVSISISEALSPHYGAVRRLSLPAVSAVATTIAAVAASEVRHKRINLPGRSGPTKLGPCAAAFTMGCSLLWWWALVVASAMLHLQVALPAVTIETVDLPPVCNLVLHKHTPAKDAKYWHPRDGTLPREWLVGRLEQVTVTPWTVPLWHAPEFVAHLHRACTNGLYRAGAANSAKQSLAVIDIWPRISLGPLLVSNPARALRLASVILQDIHSRGGWVQLFTRDAWCEWVSQRACDLRTLGLPNSGSGNASLDQVKVAFRKAAAAVYERKKAGVHGEDHEAFRTISDAYDRLHAQLARPARQAAE